MKSRRLQIGATLLLFLVVSLLPPLSGIATEARLIQTEQTATAKTPWTKLPLYVDPTNDATAYAVSNTGAEATAAGTLGSQPVPLWVGEWNDDVAKDVSKYVSAADDHKAIPVLVLYNIPNRDCGGYSSGGSKSVADYTAWAEDVAGAIGNNHVVAIVEPDALPGIDCLSDSEQGDRYAMLSGAVTELKKNPNAAVYIDAGNAFWQSTDVIAERLKGAGIDQADGFSLNVANSVSTSENQAYGDKISRALGGKHFVIDTSRNGKEVDTEGSTCNSKNRAIGVAPTTNTGDPLNDAFLWIKIPWESDGACNGDPAAGTPMWNLAVTLTRNAK